MDKHYGTIVEYVVRKNGFSITDLAFAVSVNRRTIYNWFQQPHLKKNFIYTIGHAIKHDFSNEFPEHFTPNDFIFEALGYKAVIITDNVLGIDSEKWKSKYISLLEAYNLLLLN